MSGEIEERYPEHAKLDKVKGQSQTIGEFLDYSGYELCKWHDSTPSKWEHQDTGEWLTREEMQEQPLEIRNWCGFPHDYGMGHYEPGHGAGYQPVTESIQRVLARYFEIDLDKLEEEKRAMLDDIRKLNEEAGHLR